MGNETVLVQNAERALGERKSMAAAGPSLRVDVTTPAAFLQETWELFGDGRRLIDPTERRCLMLQALVGLAAEEEAPLRATMGTAKLLGSFVARYAGVDAFEETVRSVMTDPAALSDWPEGQRAALEVVARYLAVCHERQLVEPGMAARMLRDDGLSLTVQAEEPLFVSLAQGEWLESLGVVQSEEVKVLPLSPEVSPSFMFLAGSTVIARAVKESIDEAVAEGMTSLVVFALEPLDLYDALAPYLKNVGVQAACKARVAFFDTWLGSAFHAVQQMQQSAMDWKVQATDFAYSPFSGMKLFEAQAFNTSLRQDSLMEKEQAEAWLREGSPTFEAFEQFVAHPSLEALETLRCAMHESCKVPAADKQRENAAFEGLRKLVSVADQLNGTAVISAMIEDLSVPVSHEVVCTGDVRARVEFRPMDAMGAFAQDSVDAVIFADMTKDAFAIPSAKPATHSILRRLGIEDSRDEHEEMRAAFAGAERAARKRFACIVPMRTLSGKQKYPSFIYDEFVEALSEGNAFAVDAEGLFHVPEVARPAFRLLDEEDVVEGFGQTFQEPVQTLRREQPEEGKLKRLKMRDFMWMAPTKPHLPVLSASQMEAYVQCPYHWFISRKIRVDALDETFDGLHQGLFAHEVFRRTFDALADEGVARVTSENLEQVQEKAARAFDELLDAQRHEDPGNRCALASLQDEMSMREMKQQVMNALGFMVQMPPGFEVVQGEFKLRPEDGIEYAGAVMNGSVDRIDASSQGTYAVLDYKGSVNGHEGGWSEESLDELPAKIQALIYAQALGRAPEFAGLACVGAMYLNYRAQDAESFSAGSYDVRSYDMRALSKKEASVVQGDFGAFLALVEEKVAASVVRMMEGDIAPDPRPGACRFCEVAFCDKRMAE